MKKRIACLILMLSIVFGAVSFNATQAWFAVGTKKHQYLTSGDISYVLSGGFVDFNNTDILPATELVDSAFSLTNSSNIDTQLRIKIVYSYYNSSGAYVENGLYNSSDNDSVLQVTMDPAWERGADNYYYYNGDDYVIPAASSQTIPVISSMMYSGPNTSIYNSGHSFDVRLVVESKQAHYVEWLELS